MMGSLIRLRVRSQAGVVTEAAKGEYMAGEPALFLGMLAACAGDPGTAHVEC